MPKLEQKEKLDRTRFAALLRNCLNALESNQGFDVTVNGERHAIPAKAMEKGMYQVEYEEDQGEYELELTLKWR